MGPSRLELPPPLHPASSLLSVACTFGMVCGCWWSYWGFSCPGLALSVPNRNLEGSLPSWELHLGFLGLSLTKDFFLEICIHLISQVHIRRYVWLFLLCATKVYFCELGFVPSWVLRSFLCSFDFRTLFAAMSIGGSCSSKWYMSIYLVYLRTTCNYLCIYASMYLCIDLCVDLSIYLSIYLSIHLSIYSLLDILCKKYEYSGFSVQNHKRLEKTKTQRSLTRIGIVMWSGQPKNLPKRGSLGK